MKTYDATINGISHTFQLSDEDAVKRGLDPAKDSVEAVKLAESPLDFGTPTTDGQDVEANAEANAKARTVANKAAAANTK